MRMLCIPIIALAALSACAPPRAVRVTPPAKVQAAAKALDGSAAPVSEAIVSDIAIETPVIFAAELLPPSMIAGPQFQVSPEVQLQGNMASFMVKSDYGRLDAVSVELLEQRILEVSALAQLEKMSELKVFGKAAATGVKNTGKALYNVFRDPEATARAIPEGIRNKVANTWASIKLKSKELSDDARSKIRDESAPPEFNAFLADPPSTPEKTWQDRAKSQGTKFGLNYIGYNKARRELTRELQIDPYTNNPQIEDRLDAFAWSYLAGSKGTGMAIGAITGGASFVVSKAGKINSLVYDLPPEDVKKHNSAQLKSIGIDGDIARFFLRNDTFTPTMQTAVTDSIVADWEATGWKDLLAYLRYVDSEIEARFIVNSLHMLAELKAQGQSTKGVMMVGVNPVIILADGTLVVPAPVDFVHHNAKLKAFLGEPQLRSRHVRLLVSGIVSEQAKLAIAARGWELVQQAKFAGRPEYGVDSM
jgi:hypothetical protein